MKGRFPPELIEKIRAGVNLVDIAGEHVVLRKTGSNHMGQCPFHADRTPSFSVSETKGVFHCYGCQKGGDLFAFVMEIFGISFPEAVEELAERARIPIPREFRGQIVDSGDPAVQGERAAARERLALAFKLNRFAAAFFHHQLERMPVARDYLGRRGVNEELKRAFYVGSAPASWDALAIHLLEKKAPVDLAVELGLIRPSQKRKPGQPPYFDLFRNRVIFPILDMRGKVVGFGGRSLPTEESSDSDGPKYLNSSGSFVFEKEKVVFGLPQAVKHIRDLNEVILVEGYFDVLALHAAGFCNAVATCGTSLTAQHLAAFRRFAGKVTVLFDGDKAGMAATERAMELGLDHGLVLHGAAMPEGLDPDEVIFDPETGESTAGGKGRMAAILGGAKPLLDTRIDQEVRLAVDGPEARTQALKRVAGWLSRFRDQLGREIRMQTVQEGLGVSRDLLMRAMGADSQPGVGGRTVSVRPPAVGRVNVDRSREVTRPGKRVRGQGLSEGDRILLEALVCPGDSHRWLSEVRNRLPSEGTLSELFDYPPAGEFVVRLVDGAGVSEHFLRSPEAYIDPTLDAQVRSTLTKAMVCTEVAWDAGQLKRAIQRAVARCWLRFARRIEMELDGPEAKKDKELQSRLMKEFLDVQRRLKEFKRFYEQA